MECEIIADRVYHVDGRPDQTVIHFQILRPSRLENNYPTCRYRLVVEGTVREKKIPGVDAVDCISRSLIMAGTEIAGLNESVYNHALRWAGWSGGEDIGLPTVETAAETRDLYAEAQRWALDRQSKQEP